LGSLRQHPVDRSVCRWRRSKEAGRYSSRPHHFILLPTHRPKLCRPGRIVCVAMVIMVCYFTSPSCTSFVMMFTCHSKLNEHLTMLYIPPRVTWYTWQWFTYQPELYWFVTMVYMTPRVIWIFNNALHSKSSHMNI